MPRRHTAKSAGYQRDTMTVVGDSTTGLVRHYVITRHGAVARAFTFGPGPLRAEVALWRPSNRHPQFQGYVARVGGRFDAHTPDGRFVASAVDYLDAESELLRLHTRTRSYASGPWPFEIRRELLWSRMQSGTTCEDCGHPLVRGGCTRPDLHWTEVEAP
jgi:hypothetical protein